MVSSFVRASSAATAKQFLEVQQAGLPLAKNASRVSSAASRAAVDENKENTANI